MKRCYSLKRNKEFRYVYRVGKSKSSRLLVLLYANSRQEQPLVGFSVSKKIGGSVKRNRVKRRMKEAITPFLSSVKGHTSLILIAREALLDAAFPAIVTTMKKLLTEAEVLKRND